jgi:VanZ family protein
MQRIFSPDSPYKKRARFIAIIWTLLIFIGCFTPGQDLPKVDVPLIDKWTHLVLFGGFTFLWLCAQPRITAKWLFSLFIISAAMGGLIEVLQGVFTSLGRSMEFMDGVADTIGGALGIAMFCTAAYFTNRKKTR